MGYISGNCKRQTSPEDNLSKKCAFCDENFEDTEGRSKHYLQEHLQNKGEGTVEGISQSPSDITKKALESINRGQKEMEQQDKYDQQQHQYSEEQRRQQDEYDLQQHQYSEA